MKGKKRLFFDEQHRKDCHERWMKRRNRRQEESNYKDEWYSQQCGGCRYFVPLTGALAEDWGACTNLSSDFDGRVMFEHDGCSFYEEAIDGWNPIPR